MSEHSTVAFTISQKKFSAKTSQKFSAKTSQKLAKTNQSVSEAFSEPCQISVMDCL